MRKEFPFSFASISCVAEGIQAYYAYSRISLAT